MAKKYAVETTFTSPMGHYSERGFSTQLDVSANGLLAYPTNNFCYVAKIDDLINPIEIIKSPDSCYSVNFSHDSNLLAIGNSKEAIVYEMTKKECIKNYPRVGKSKVKGLGFSADDKYLLIAGDLTDNGMFCMNVHTNENHVSGDNLYGDFTNLAVSDKNHVVGTLPQGLVSYTFSPLKCVLKRSTKALINTVRFIPQSDKILVGMMSHPITIFDFETLEAKTELKCDSNASVFGFAICPTKPNTLVSAHGIAASLNIWDLEKGVIVHTINNCASPHSTKVGKTLINCAMHHNTLVGLSLDGHLISYDMRNFEMSQQIDPIQINKFPRMVINSPIYFENSHSVCVSDSTSTINLFKGFQDKKFTKYETLVTEKYPSEDYLMNCVKINESTIALNYNTSLKTFNIPTLEFNELTEKHPHFILSICGGKMLLLYYIQSQQLEILNVATKSIKTLLKGIKEFVSMQFCDESSTLALVHQNYLNIYSFDQSSSTLKKIHTENETSTSSFVAVEFEKNGSRIAVLYSSGIKFFKIDSGTLTSQGLRYCPLSSVLSSALAWNQWDNSLIALGYSDGTLVLVDDKKMYSSHTTIVPNLIHNSRINNLQWIDQSTLLVSSNNLFVLVDVKPLK